MARQFRRDDLPPLRALRGEVVSSQVQRVQIPGRPDIRLSVSAAPIFTQEGQVRGAVTIFADVTAYQRLQYEVQRRAAELDATLTSIADGLIIYSPEGEILLDNPAARRLLDGILIDEEYSSHFPQWVDLLGITPHGERLAPDDVPAARASRGETVTGEVLEFHHKDGTVDLAVGDGGSHSATR